jgi:5-methylcytosine-specific restriction endonuclease McrA
MLDINDTEIDHIKPYSKGGETTFENAQLTHRHCNRSKRDNS